MKTKTPVTELKLGMYVEELDRPWVGAPFLFQGFEITSEKLLERLRNFCEFVYVLPDRDRTPMYRRRRAPTTAGAAVHRLHPGELRRVLRDAPVEKLWHPDQTSVEQELEQAREIETKARDSLYTILEDSRLGRSVHVGEAKKVVADMVESIIRNPDAMVVLTQLKNVDEYTALHSLRVCVLALTFGRHLEMTREELNLLGLGALLHDVGKMKVPLDILNKPGRLTDEEFAIMKSHVPEGVKVLEAARGIPTAAIEVARGHHERYGGGGYAAGVAGDTIHPFGLIAGIVDCYDAITSDRVYQQGISPQDALTRMYGWRTRDFHPGLVEQFIQCMGIYPIGSLVELSNGSVGVVVTVNRERRLLPKVVVVLDRHLKPLQPPRMVDLMYEAGSRSKPALTVRKVLPPGTHGISAVDYLPIRG